MLRRSPGGSSVPDEVQVEEIRGPRMKRSGIQQLKLRTRCARCLKLGHSAGECPEGNRGQRNDERYDRRALRPGENSRGSHQCSKAHGEKTLSFSVHPGHSFLSTPEKSYGILLPKRDSSGNNNLINGVNCSRNTVSKSNGARKSQNPQVESEARQNQSCCVCVPVGLAGCNGTIRFTVVEQDVPPLLPVGIMRTLQAGLDLTDDGDEVIFRQFGGESSLRTLQSGHTVIRADQFDPDGWQLPEITELCQDNDEGCATNYMSVIAHVYQRPICKDNDTSAGDHDPAITRSCRLRQKTTSNDNGPARSHPAIFPTSSPRFKSGKQMHGAFQNPERDIWTSSQCHQSRRGSTAWNTVDDQTVETPRSLHGVRAMRGIIRHPVSGISDVDPHGTIGEHPACIATTGATRDEGQEEQCCEFSGGSVAKPYREATGELRGRRRRTTTTIHRMPFRKEATHVWESVAAQSPDHGSTGSRDEAKPSHSACVYREATGRNRTPLLSAQTREHDDTGHAATESPLGMLNMQYHLRTQPGRVRCSTCRPGELRGCRREHGSH